MKNRSEMVDLYVEAHEEMWAYSTWRTTRSRLKALGSTLDLEADDIYAALKNKHNLSPYTVKTTLSIISAYFDWLVSKGYIPFNRLLAIKKKLNRTGDQRNAYKKRSIGSSYSEALLKIDRIEKPEVRNHAEFLLKSGLRIHESYITFVEGDKNYVIGKGSKKRRVFSSTPNNLVKPHLLRDSLSKIGLKPHDLRKLFATRLVNKGMPLQDVCEVMGWSSIQTAMNYLQNASEDSLNGAIKEALDG